jgi:hypothetical protein
VIIDCRCRLETVSWVQLLGRAIWAAIEQFCADLIDIDLIEIAQAETITARVNTYAIVARLRCR